jgi:nanoRNase/pAp phosphatase (c-di-AMP/oligoRNAs hydrolase)
MIMTELTKKTECSTKEYLANIQKIHTVFQEWSSYLFYFSPDPDAVGSSIALALYLRLLEKDCYIYLPDGFDPNLNFLFDIAQYNSIEILKNDEQLLNCLEAIKPVIISADTPNHHLLPHYDKVSEILSENRSPSIEIDHHFGGDSELIFPESIPLFTRSNSCCEIIADVFQVFGTQHDKEMALDRLFPRNVVLCLLVGICFDTQFGKYLVNSDTYNRWFYFFSERLRWLTWDNPDYINTSQQVFDTINSMNDAKDKTLRNLLDDIVIQNSTGLLIMPYYNMYQSLSENGDSTCIMSKLIGDLSNMVPEAAGSAGILAFYDTTSRIYLMKIRRSHRFSSYDLRQLEKSIRDIFGSDFLGGGGHAGATSFRIQNIERELFVEKAKQLHTTLAGIISAFPIITPETVKPLLSDEELPFDEDEDDPEFIETLKKDKKRSGRPLFYKDKSSSKKNKQNKKKTAKSNKIKSEKKSSNKKDKKDKKKSKKSKKDKKKK